MNITLVRHGEIDEKYIGRYNGHIDIELSKKGLQDAKRLGIKLQEKTFDAIFCSDLKRAKDTLSQFPHAKDNVIYTNRLREKSWGRHEGMSFDEITSKEGIKYKNFLQWINCLDGESIEEFQTRIKEFFFEYLQNTDKKDILIITHSGVIKTFLSITKKTPLKEAFSLDIPYCSVTSASLF